MPVNILVRDVADDTRDALAARARERGQSLQAYVHDLITVAARRSANLALLDAARSLGGGLQDDSSHGDLVALREERETRLSSTDQ